VLLPWKGKLVSFNLPSNDPLGNRTQVFKSVGKDGFRLIRKDELPGQYIWFERDSTGKVKRVWQNNNYVEKIR
jgi:hypothetical protein